MAGPAEAGAKSAPFATFNASTNRGAEGELAAALTEGGDQQIAEVAAMFRVEDPDVILAECTGFPGALIVSDPAPNQSRLSSSRS